MTILLTLLLSVQGWAGCAGALGGSESSLAPAGPAVFPDPKSFALEELTVDQVINLPRFATLDETGTEKLARHIETIKEAIPRDLSRNAAIRKGAGEAIIGGLALVKHNFIPDKLIDSPEFKGYTLSVFCALTAIEDTPRDHVLVYDVGFLGSDGFRAYVQVTENWDGADAVNPALVSMLPVGADVPVLDLMMMTPVPIILN